MRSDNERTLLSLIERVMSNLTGVELMCSVREIKAREVNDQSSRALETTPYTRRALGVVSGAGAPAVRPQHVEVSVEEKYVEVRVHDARKARSRESIKPAMVDETRTAKLYPSLRLKEDPHTR